MPATSRVNIYGFIPHNFENNLKVFISSLIDFQLLKKMLRHLHTQHISSDD